MSHLYRFQDAAQRRCVCGAWSRKPSPSKRKVEKQPRRSKKTSTTEKKPGDGKIRFLSKWEVFSPEAYQTVPAWEVPWGWQTTALGMIAWGASFLLAGIITIPLGINFLGVTEYKSMTAIQQSEIQLFDQVQTYQLSFVQFLACEALQHLHQSLSMCWTSAGSL
jgi:hypothetical protein